MQGWHMIAWRKVNDWIKSNIRMNERNKWMNEGLHERMNEWTNDWMNEWMNKSMDWMNDWKKHWLIEWLKESLADWPMGWLRINVHECAWRTLKKRLSENAREWTRMSQNNWKRTRMNENDENERDFLQDWTRLRLKETEQDGTTARMNDIVHSSLKSQSVQIKSQPSLEPMFDGSNAICSTFGGIPWNFPPFLEGKPKNAQWLNLNVWRLNHCFLMAKPCWMWKQQVAAVYVHLAVFSTYSWWLDCFVWNYPQSHWLILIISIFHCYIYIHIHTFHYIALHSITFHSITFHYIPVHSITLHNIHMYL